MLKLIHSRFELDLSKYNISINEENHWFSDRFFTKYTFPFEFQVTDELNEAFGDLRSHNSNSSETYFEVFFYLLGKEHEAVFEIEEIVGTKGTGEVRFGFEELPNYNKKLSELPLDNFAIADPATIYTHAESVITKTWPEVSHNFVQVFTDYFDTSEAQWEAFEGIINKRTGGAFVINEYDEIEDKQLNRNIMQPQPYILHVLQKGFEDAGLTLGGDILTDNDFKKALFSEISSYYSTINIESKILQMHSGEYFEMISAGRGHYIKDLVLTEKGRYKIAGIITTRQFITHVWSELRFNGQRIWRVSGEAELDHIREIVKNININVDFNSGATATLQFESYQYIYANINGEWVVDEPICDLTITQLAKYGAQGELVPTLILPNEVKLQKCVPDMTFGELLTVLKNWRNLDFELEGNNIDINYIEGQLDIENAKSLNNYEVKLPRRLSSKGKSFLLKFQDISSDEYLYEELFISNTGTSKSNYATNEDTSEIIINAIPLPVVNKEGVVTADHFLDDSSRLKVILYEGAPAIENLAEDNSGLLIPSVYDNYYTRWIAFRINGQTYIWLFKMTEEALRDLSIRDKVHAYNNHHIVKSLNKELLVPGLWVVEIETETLKEVVE